MSKANIKKAFDTVLLSLLLDKLYKIGRGNLLCLIQSYLESRSQYVCYNNTKSKIKNIEYGVPQGSILGPLFSIVFMNDFSNASKLFYTFFFADDTTVFLEGTEYSKLVETVNY